MSGHRQHLYLAWLWAWFWWFFPVHRWGKLCGQRPYLSFHIVFSPAIHRMLGSPVIQDRKARQKEGYTFLQIWGEKKRCLCWCLWRPRFSFQIHCMLSQRHTPNAYILAYCLWGKSRELLFGLKNRKEKPVFRLYLRGWIQVLASLLLTQFISPISKYLRYFHYIRLWS